MKTDKKIIEEVFEHILPRGIQIKDYAALGLDKILIRIVTKEIEYQRKLGSENIVIDASENLINDWLKIGNDFFNSILLIKKV